MEQYKKFLVPFDSTKLNLFICNDTVKKKKKKQVMMKKDLIIWNHQVIIFHARFWLFVGNTEMPYEDPLREVYPRTALPHRRPAEGDS